ncbi:phage terminase large subunit family protein [Paracoccus sp. MBLB3053]|uniref:Phage terminase large subunit family protein n=1 Tax=Paracoccus aurantius TaxID=3073814 RepID=A0ABU2HU94_9RHOB|nr:terminase gpA endonuclease subunit [Paracoccus sp. MBLB3053]MDS9468613.1 phage terminase large subunit family protein [Paracoccus sp. MBLB3053]
MVMMPDRGPGALARIAPLPPFTTPEELLADALPLLDPPSRISVTDAAERHLKVPVQGNWQAYDRLVAPYTVEPQDISQSRLFKSVCFVGPSQSGKSQMLLSVSAHAITCAQAPVQIIHMTKTDADAWVEEKLDPAIEASPSLRERLGASRDDSTFSRKRFKGMRLTIGYPVANQLSSRSQRMVLLTDYDHMPQRLGPKDSPEGTPHGMALQRIRTFMSRGCVFVESTPAFPVDPEQAWEFDPAAPHRLPPVTGGIVKIYNEGTRGRWYWECPNCAELYEPRFDRLSYDRSLEPGAAGAGAQMQCPHCGDLLSHRHKTRLNALALSGRGGWLHESRQLDAAGRRLLCRIDDPLIRQTPIASYALNGAAAAFSGWDELVERYETARRAFEASQDDIDFARVHYTDIGVPFARPEEDESGLSAAALKDAACDLAPMSCPHWTRFITVSVDVNGSWFAVLVTAWGLDGRRIALDRFDLTQPPETAPRARDLEGRFRALNPARYVEDADILPDLLDRTYAVDGEDWSLKPCAVAIDFNGPPGWADNAEKFWRKRRREGQGDLWFLSIGRGGFRFESRVWLSAPERGAQNRKARSIKLMNMAVDRLKDTVLAGAARFDQGPGSYLFARSIEQERLEELIAERRHEDGYRKRPGSGRNETLDLSVQAQALAELKGISRINPEDPPHWATLGEMNRFAIWTGRAEPPQPAAEDPDSTDGVIEWLRR